MYKHSKWASDILSAQKEDGSWGYFHTLSEPKKYPLTTEQALRRLQILGFSMADEPVQKALHYLDDCLNGNKEIPDRREKLHNWDIFTALMFSTWIRRFTNQHSLANQTAATWANIISAAFSSGEYSYFDYEKAYLKTFGLKPRGGRLIDFLTFYQIAIVTGILGEKTEGLFLDHILNAPKGIYYIYGTGPLSRLPEAFASIQASRYLGAVELLAAYPHAKEKLAFVVDWLNANKNSSGLWDMGSSVKDQIYFPLSNSWRQKENREKDCTFRIQKLIDSLV